MRKTHEMKADEALQDLFTLVYNTHGSELTVKECLEVAVRLFEMDGTTSAEVAKLNPSLVDSVAEDVREDVAAGLIFPVKDCE